MLVANTSPSANTEAKANPFNVLLRFKIDIKQINILLLKVDSKICANSGMP